MWNVIAADAWTSQSFWAWYCARRAVEQAVVAFEDAGGALASLREASNWQAQGVRALHQLLDDEYGRTTAQVGALHACLWEIERLAN